MIFHMFNLIIDNSDGLHTLPRLNEQTYFSMLKYIDSNKLHGLVKVEQWLLVFYYSDAWCVSPVQSPNPDCQTDAEKNVDTKSPFNTSKKWGGAIDFDTGFEK